MNLFEPGEKLARYSYKDISVKYLSKLWLLWTKNMNGVTVKVEILH